MSSLQTLKQAVRKFAEERDWVQFHSPKNLSMALAVEASEIMEIFQWLTQEQSRHLAEDKLAELEGELADVLIYLVRLADRLDIDLIDAANAKPAVNEERYPVDKVRGSSRKYSEYD